MQADKDLSKVVTSSSDRLLEHHYVNEPEQILAIFNFKKLELVNKMWIHHITSEKWTSSKKAYKRNICP